MHHLGMVHRDIKSHNVLIDNNFNVKVCDFGLCKFTVSTSTKFLSYLKFHLGRYWKGIDAVCGHTNIHGPRTVLKALIRSQCRCVCIWLLAMGDNKPKSTPRRPRRSRHRRKSNKRRQTRRPHASPGRRETG